MLLAIPGFCVNRCLILMYVGISQGSSGDSGCICLSPEIAFVELCSLGKKEMHLLVFVSTTNTCGHYLNKYFKNKDSENPRIWTINFFYHGCDLDTEIHEDTKSLILSIVILKKIQIRHLNMCCRCKTKNETSWKTSKN